MPPLCKNILYRIISPSSEKKQKKILSQKCIHITVKRGSYKNFLMTTLPIKKNSSQSPSGHLDCNQRHTQTADIMPADKTGTKCCYSNFSTSQLYIMTTYVKAKKKNIDNKCKDSSSVYLKCACFWSTDSSSISRCITIRVCKQWARGGYFTRTLGMKRLLQVLHWARSSAGGASLSVRMRDFWFEKTED